MNLLNGQFGLFFLILNGHRKKKKEAKWIPVVSSKNVLHFCSSGTLFHILKKVSVQYDHIGVVFKGDIQHFLFLVTGVVGCLSGNIIQKRAHSIKSGSVFVHVHLLCPLKPGPVTSPSPSSVSRLTPTSR